MEPAATIGCALYNISATVFTLCILLGMALIWHANSKRKKRLADLSWGEQMQMPKSEDDNRRERRTWRWAFLPAFCFFAVGVSTELWGIQLGLFGTETACPDGWQQPRSLRALQG